MPGPNQTDDLQLSNSVDLLQNRARKIADQSLQSTRRMVVMVDESKEVGLRTLVTLDQQGEKLARFDEVQDEIRDEIQQSEKALNDMEKCCGLFALPWPRSKLSKADKAWKKTKEDKVVKRQPQKITDDTSDLDEHLPRITNDDGEVEMDSNLAHVHSTVGNLKSMAAGINAEVRAHNRQLDKLRQKADSNDEHVMAAAQRTDKLHH
ncbi:synaptosomal-associated protein 25-like [Pectinophora gossypiella]|uniref:synaptosomal-associated protein 25-like n=1 Tax=Pectinophora gossypiella TaxID=13191 RepID=UPI00214E6EA8|nr:synaptosomal-associated protein 25-like [Pectinophora gossypiella]